MRDDVLKRIDFRHVVTIVSKDESNLNDWKEANGIPFRGLLDNRYSATYVVIRLNMAFGYVCGGSPDFLRSKLLERIYDAKHVFLTISSEDGKKERWFITRD